MKVVQVVNSLADAKARLVCGVLMVVSGGVLAQATGGDFVNRVKNAKAMDSTALLTNTTTGVNNWASIISLVAMAVGFIFFVWGVMWVMSAARSEGRKEAKPGWIMLVGGGCLGAAMALYLLFVGAASSVAA